MQVGSNQVVHLLHEMKVQGPVLEQGVAQCDQFRGQGRGLASAGAQFGELSQEGALLGLKLLGVGFEQRQEVAPLGGGAFRLLEPPAARSQPPLGPPGTALQLCLQVAPAQAKGAMMDGQWLSPPYTQHAGNS